MSAMQISIILPCLNEAENIRTTVDGVLRWFRSKNFTGEVIVVNDGSTDATPDILAEMQRETPALKVLTHAENCGYGAAVLSGCDVATGDIMGFMDSDGQFLPEDFDRLLPFFDKYSFVTGRRRRRADPFMRKVNAKLFGVLSFLILGVWVRDVNCAMKLWKREIWSRIRPTFATGALVNAEIFYRLKRAGIPYAQTDVRHLPRQFGAQTGARFSVILRMFRELIQLRISGK